MTRASAPGEGYTTSGMKQIVRDITGAPALLPATVLARVLAELA